MAAPATLQLPESLGSAAAEDLLASLRDLRGQPLSLDASRVRRVGAQCAQVLLSAAATWRADGAVLGIDEPSTEFQEALRLLGLSVGSVSAGAVAS
jgi:chemotaxis protein CheX